MKRFVRGRRLELASERGQSLVLALVVMSALTITIGALADLTTGTEHSMGRDRQDLRAFAVAESGISDAIAVISDPSYDGSDTQGPGTVLGPTPLDTGIDGATGSFTATKYGATDSHCVPGEGASENPCWVIVSTATSSDGKVTRSLQQTIYYNESVSDVSGVYGMGLFVDNGTGPCVKTSGSPDMVVDNFYISGCFQPKGNTDIRPSVNNTGTGYVGGLFDPSGGASIGTPTFKYNLMHMPGGCTGATCGLAGSNVYATTTDGVTIPLQRPAMLTVPLYTYGKSDGQPGDPTVVSWKSSDVCSPANAFWLDDNNVADRSLTTDNRNPVLMPPANTVWSCHVYLSDGTLLGSISSNGNGTIDVEGTLFVDGDLSITNDGHYTGKGTIYVNGIVTGNGSGTLDICGPQKPGTYAVQIDHSCDPTNTKIWDRDTGELVIAVINPFDNPQAFRIDAQGELDASVVVNQGYTDIGGVVVVGSVVADNATISGSSGLVPASGGAINSAPSKVITITGWTEQPGSWKQLQ